MEEKELKKRLGALERKLRQHHRMINLNLVVIIMLSVSIILTSLKVARVLDILSKIIQMYQDGIALFSIA